MKKTLLTLLLTTIAMYTLGCATILGGIIGYQSGELVAGAAIGAAVDFGDDIAEGLGQLFTDKEVRFEQKVSLDSKEGRISLAKSDFSLERVEKLIRKLEKKFEENGWSYTLVEKKNRVGRTLLSEKWHCKKPDDGEFELSVLREKHKDTQVSIEPVGEEALSSRDAITVQVYTWLKEASLGAP